MNINFKDKANADYYYLAKNLTLQQIIKARSNRNWNEYNMATPYQQICIRITEIVKS